MPFRQVTSRRRVFHGLLRPHQIRDVTPEYGHNAELVMDLLYATANLMFVVGSVCFFANLPRAARYAGAILFLIGSVFTAVCAFITLLENIAVRSAKAKVRPGRNEVLESINYVIAGVLFAVGSVLWVPGVFHTPGSKVVGQGAGTWLFILGSFSLTLASYANAIGLATERGWEGVPDGWARTCFRIDCFGLGCTQIGSVLFVAGSFLYRPGFENHCEERGAEGAANEVCISTSFFGTKLYVVGSVFFLMQSVSVIINGFLRRNIPDHDPWDEEEPLTSRKLIATSRV